MRNGTIAVLGANGVFGRHLIPRLAAAGHSVRAVVRRPETAGFARGCEADVRTADLYDAVSLRAAVEGCELVVNLATSLPGPSGRGDYESNDRLRRDGTPKLLRACREAGVSRVLQQSIALLNGSGTDAWSDEDTEAPPSQDPVLDRAVEAARSMERSVADSGLDCMILRGGLFYGPGTGFDDDWFARAKAGKLRLPGDGSAFVSLVHIADMAAATLAAIDIWPEQRTLIVADDRPVRWIELFSHVALVAGAAPPEPGGRIGFASFRVRNRRAREALGWKPLYREMREGLAR